MSDALANAKDKANHIKDQEDQIKALLNEIDIHKRKIEEAKAEIK